MRYMASFTYVSGHQAEITAIIPKEQAYVQVLKENGTIEELIQARGWQALFLPAYSPDFSPYARNLFQVQSVPAPSGSAHTRSVAGGHFPGVTHRDRAGYGTVGFVTVAIVLQRNGCDGSIFSLPAVGREA